MRLQDILKTLRQKKGYTQEQVAQKLFISTQAVSKWENGLSIPSIDNLLTLSDLYDISLDELVQGSPFFKKPYLVGNKYNFKKGLLFIVIWLLFSLLFTGLGYQPIWLFLLIFMIGMIVVFPTVFNDYWVIENHGIRIKKYSQKNFSKLAQLLTNNQTTIEIPYADIISTKIVYQTKQRVSPFDFSFDLFYLQVCSEEGTYNLTFDTSVKKFLPQFVGFLQRHHIEVIDDDCIIELIIAEKSLYEHFNRTDF